MDPPREAPPVVFQGSSSSLSRSPGTDRAPSDLPPIWEHLARPETQEEYFDGELRLKMPAKPPHARQHFQLARVLAAHVTEGYLGAVEMLTRTSRGSDFAPDASVYPAAPDPASGERQLEELAFEVCSEQSLEVPTFKARELVNRGVRRVFCIVVGGAGRQRRKKLAKSYLLEWSHGTDTWSRVPDDTVIEDRCLEPAMPVRGLLEATAGDDAVARALVARRNRIVEEERARSFAAGEVKGFAAGEVARQTAERRVAEEAAARQAAERRVAEEAAVRQAAERRAAAEAAARQAAERRVAEEAAARQAANRRSAQLLAAVLEQRGLILDDRARRRILDCNDPRELERWIEHAFTVATVEDLWADRPR